MNDIVSKFSNHLKNVLTRALCLVVDTKGDSITPKHLLWALVTQQGSVASEILTKAGLRAEDLRAFAGETNAAIPPSMLTNKNLIPVLSGESKAIIEKAVLMANIHEHRYIGTEHLLSGMLHVAPAEVMQFFETHNINARRVNQNIATVFKTTTAFPDFPDKTTTLGPTLSEIEDMTFEEIEFAEDDKNQDSKTPALDYFTEQLTTEEAAEQIDPVIGRKTEIQRLMKILSRRTKNNPVLVGEPGVGKTAIVEGLAKKIVEGTVPDALSDKHIFRLDLASLIAGTMYRGEFESRLRQLIDEVTERPDIILFVDEVHTIMGAGAASGSLDAANILKPALARGDIRCIGATTPNEYKKFIETDGALERRFQQIKIQEPSLSKTREILVGVQPFYENHHKVSYTKEAIESALALSDKYLTGKHFPDKALDLLDEAGAAANLKRKKTSSLSSIKKLQSKLEQIQKKKNETVLQEKFSKAASLKAEEAKVSAKIKKQKAASRKRRRIKVDEIDIIQVVAEMTGIPLTALSASQEKQLRELERELKKHIFGQEDVVKRVASAIRRAKLGLAREDRPLASFIFTGPSGVGKTEMAKTIANSVFKKDASFLRLDMSEYSAPFTVSKLIGAPAGYVGYREQTKFSDHVKQNPHTVILFDEIEKAHPDVHQLLLQILDDGMLSDATGKNINFRHAIIIMTSNIGSERFERGRVGFSRSDIEQRQVIEQDVRKDLEDHFSREFLNRIDNVCIFEPLSQASLEAIARREIIALKQRLKAKGSDITLTKATIQHLVKRAKTKFGARDIQRLVQTEIEQPLVEALLASKNNQKFKITLKKDGTLRLTRA
ncbi:ATP-dependent Clp protease ATP-binding subunit [Patescibacteria group bacterium]|nr:ATP-dependent Clp protease ATP-binding subunit [Patescibacteria group bacterium]